MPTSNTRYTVCACKDCLQLTILGSPITTCELCDEYCCDGIGDCKVPLHELLDDHWDGAASPD